MAFALVVVALLGSWRGVLLVVGGTLLALVATSDAFARRGGGRTAAAIVAVAGIAAVAAGFAAAQSPWRRTVIIVLVIVVSLVMARASLRRAEVRRLAASVTPVARAQRPVLIINPRSGGGRASRHQLVEACRERGVEAIVLEPGTELRAVADDAIARGADVIGMAGGDGSQALIAETAIRHGIPMVVVPAGTRNHFALDLGLDRNDVVGALDAFAHGLERAVDVATVNGRVFVNNVALGIYAKLVQTSTYRDAKARTIADNLPDLLGPGAEPLDLRFIAPDGTVQTTAHLVLVSNGPYRLHRLAVGRFRRARLDGGALGLATIRFSSAREVGRFVTLETTGRVHQFPGWYEWSATRFRVDSSGPVEVGVDGEALSLEPPLLFEIRPRALQVRLPHAAVGSAAADRQVQVLSRSTLTALARVVAGRDPVTSR